MSTLMPKSPSLRRAGVVVGLALAERALMHRKPRQVRASALSEDYYGFAALRTDRGVAAFGGVEALIAEDSLGESAEEAVVVPSAAEPSSETDPLLLR